MGTANEVLALAAGEIGTTEHPPGSNRTTYAAAAGHPNGYPWCASFVVAVFRAAAVKLPSESAYTPTMANAFKKEGRWYRLPRRGDLAFFDFPDNTSRVQHVGIVESFTATTVTCIEGNTSPGTTGSQANGGGVWRRTRPYAHVVGFGRPAYTEDIDDMFSDQDRDRDARIEAMLKKALPILEDMDRNSDARMDAINGHTTKEAGKVVAAAKELRDNAVRAVERMIVAALKPSG